MGTNYYLQTDFCPCCGKPRQTLHLGQSSHGWKFLFHQQPRIFDYESFYRVIDTGIIVHDYERQLSKDDLIDIIEYHEFKEERLIELQYVMLRSYEYQSFKESGNIEDLLDSYELMKMKGYNEFLAEIDERGLDRYVEGDYLELRDLTGDQFHRGEWNAFSSLLTEWAQNNGYDGILSEAGGLDKRIREIVVFEPNQIKSVDNLYPTKSDNFRDNSREYLKEHLKDMSFDECMKLTKHIKEQEKQNTIQRSHNRSERYEL